MISTIALFWALCVVCVVNMARYFSSLRALLVVLRGCDPLLYQYVDGGGFFTSHGQPSKHSPFLTGCGWCGISMPSATVTITMMNLFVAANVFVASLS